MNFRTKKLKSLMVTKHFSFLFADFTDYHTNTSLTSDISDQKTIYYDIVAKSKVISCLLFFALFYRVTKYPFMARKFRLFGFKNYIDHMGKCFADCVNCINTGVFRSCPFYCLHGDPLLFNARVIKKKSSHISKQISDHI
jgi:hypothetical protein